MESTLAKRPATPPVEEEELLAGQRPADRSVCPTGRRLAPLSAALTVVLSVVCAGVAVAAGPRAPELRFEDVTGQPATSPVGRPDDDHLRRIVELTGLEDPGPPIRVVLVPENSALGRGTPAWIAGVAYARSDRVLLFAARSPRYPHDSLSAVLHHEVAHVLIHRAAAGQSVPRWFDEGLATFTERSWTAEDRRQLAWALATSSPVRMETVDAGFAEGANRAARSYALGSAFVRQIVERHGIEAPARILRGLAGGDPFALAFERATGERFADAERTFSASVASWERWIPLLTSPFVLWTATTVLALYAVIVFRVRRARRWEAEAEDETWPDDSSESRD